MNLYKFAVLENPIKNAPFSHYEIRTVADYKDGGGTTYTEEWNEYEDTSTRAQPYYALYGRFNSKKTDGRQSSSLHILDMPDFKSILDILEYMGILAKDNELPE
jgi:hypothetical protein